MKWLAIALMYLGFFGLIGFAVFATQSAVPLWALFLCPSVKDKCCEGTEKEDGE